MSVLAIAIAESVPNFDIVMSVIGGTLTSPLIFFLPPLIYIRMLHLQKKYQQSMQETSFTNVVLNEETTANGRTKLERDEFKLLENHSATSTGSSILVKCEIVFCLLIVLISFLLTSVTTYFNLSNAVAAYSYSNATMPCIYNVTMALLYL